MHNGPYFRAHGWFPTLLTLTLLVLGAWKAVELVIQVIS